MPDYRVRRLLGRLTSAPRLADMLAKCSVSAAMPARSIVGQHADQRQLDVRQQLGRAALGQVAVQRVGELGGRLAPAGPATAATSASSATSSVS